MAERTYRFSEGTEERIKEVQTEIKYILNLPEPPTEQFTISVMMCLGLGVINDNAKSSNPIQYSHPKNFREFVLSLYEIYKNQRS